MRILDLFSGTGSSTAWWWENHQVVRVEIEERFSNVPSTNIMNVLDIDEKWVGEHGPFDVVWASPPCTFFSMARQINEISFAWNPNRTWIDPQPMNEGAELAVELVKHTLQIIEWANPKWYFIENPATGHLPRFKMMKQLMNHTVTYDRYGEDMLKPTQIMGQFPWTWEPRCPTKSKEWDGSNFEELTGNQSKNTRKWERSLIPVQLVSEIREACENAERSPQRPYSWITFD